MADFGLLNLHWFKISFSLFWFADQYIYILLATKNRPAIWKQCECSQLLRYLTECLLVYSYINICYCNFCSISSLTYLAHLIYKKILKLVKNIVIIRKKSFTNKCLRILSNNLNTQKWSNQWPCLQQYPMSFLPWQISRNKAYITYLRSILQYTFLWMISTNIWTLSVLMTVLRKRPLSIVRWEKTFLL